MSKLSILEKEIKKIKERNINVEYDKSWETSCTRKLLIVILTYLVTVIFFYFANLPNPLINSIVPSLAFIISSFTLPIFKKIWLNNYKK